MRFPLSRRQPRLRLGALALCVALSSGVAFAAALAEVAEEQGSSEVAQAAAPADQPPSEAKPPAQGAGPEGATPPGIEVMRVKGRGAAAIEADVPSSLTLFDAKTIEALGAQDISDLSRVTPNVNIVQPGATQATFFVRGVGLSDFSSNAAGAVTIIQDDVAINAPAIQTGQLFDVEGIEVVRGPQGTGPYRNASAGAIRVRSRRPTGNYTAQLRSSIGTYDTKGDKGARNALIQDYEGALETPIVPGWLSSRFAFRLREAEPYKRNGCGNALPVSARLPRVLGSTNDDPRIRMCSEGNSSFPPLGGSVPSISRIPEGLPKWVDDEHNWAARGMLRFHPEDTDFDLTLNGHGSQLSQDSTLGQAIGTQPQTGAPGDASGQIPRFGGASNSGYIDPDVRKEFERLCGRSSPGVCDNQYVQAMLTKRLAQGRPLDEKPYRGDYDRVGQTTRDAWGAFLSGEGNLFADTKLSAIVSYDTYKRSQSGDTDFTPDVQFEQVQADEAWQMYDQLQLEGELGFEPIEWNVGGYYLRERLHNDGTIFLAGQTNRVTGAPGAFIRRLYTQDLESFGLWGGFGWDFADDFTLEGGVRYNWERKHFDQIVDQNIPFRTTGSSAQSELWDTPTGQLILTYHIDDSKSAFAKYSRGFKAGHFNANASALELNPLFTKDPPPPPANEEYNDAWEAGLRGAWFNRRLSLATAYFYYRYTNYQVFLFVDSADAAQPPTLAILNAKQAENFGIEVEGAVQPLLGWVPNLFAGLRLSGNFSWLHGEYIDFVTARSFDPKTGTGVSNIPVSYSGRPLQNAPKFKASGTAEWTFDLGRWGYLIPRYDINWSDDVFFDPNEGHGSVDPTGGPGLVDYGVGQKAFFLHNVRLAYRTPTSNVEIAGWIRNVEDQTYKNFAFDASRFTNIVINFPGEPRTIGVDFTITF
jgi:outer membrane receptor protein involved in Fe transport